MTAVELPEFVEPCRYCNTAGTAEQAPSKAKFAMGEAVKKVAGARWRGLIVGFYSTQQTPIGYCVESHFEPGSVQIYPEAALTRWEDYYGA